MMSIAGSAVPTAASQNASAARFTGSIDASRVDASQDDLRMLDDPHEWAAFSRPDAAGVNCWESNLLIEGMHCAACALSIEEALMRVPLSLIHI